MKIYFDSLVQDQSNLSQLDSFGKNDWWLCSKGTIIKRVLNEIGKNYNLLSDIDEPGIYIIDVNGDPNWWGGQAKGNTPNHILLEIPQNIIDLVNGKRLRIVISADKEGGPMVNQYFDVFAETTKIMQERGMPTGSVIILQGNKKISDDYDNWLETKNQDRLFEVQYSNHFGNIFFDDKMPSRPCILNALENKNSLDFNSLNRVYRPHRGAHLYFLIKNNVLDKGKVSCNQINYNDPTAAILANTSKIDFANITKHQLPIFLDGDWSKTNAAWNYNKELYDSTFLTVVTETIFIDNTAFVTEKIFKPIALGHPFILVAGQGTLKALREMGFKTNFLGIDEDYDYIENPVRRFEILHRYLLDFIKKDRNEKIKLIEKSLDNIQHNFDLIRKENFYHRAIKQAIESSEKYFEKAI